MASAAPRISVDQDALRPLIRTASPTLAKNIPAQIMPTGDGTLICGRTQRTRLKTPDHWLQVCRSQACSLTMKGSSMAESLSSGGLQHSLVRQGMRRHGHQSR